ncbi:MAG: hypothetical protein AAF226_08200 [Verrucomicrobiota bacterium]
MRFCLIFSLVISSIGFSKDPTFTTDASWHFENKLKSTWEKADANLDGVITIADKGGWWHNRAKDFNQDQKVTLDEFKQPIPLQNAEKPSRAP